MSLRLGSVQDFNSYRLGDIEFSATEGTLSGTATLSFDSSAVLSGPADISGTSTLDFAHSANLTSVERTATAQTASGVPGVYITFTLSGFSGAPTGATFNGISTSIQNATASSVDVLIPILSEYVSGGNHAATRWNTAQEVVVSEAGGSAGDSIQVTPPDTDGPDDWFYAATGSPYPGDSLHPAGVADGDEVFVDRVSGTVNELQTNGSISWTTSSGEVNVRYYDVSADSWSAITNYVYDISGDLMVGSTTLSFASTAGLDALADLSTTSLGIAFGQTTGLSVLTGVADFSGSTALSFEGFALLGGGSVLDMVGSSEIVFGSSALLTTQNLISGSTTFDFAASGSLEGVLNATGAAVLVFSTSADIQYLYDPPRTHRVILDNARTMVAYQPVTLMHVMKDPSDVVEVGIDWRPELEGANISTSTWAAEAGLTVDSSSRSNGTANAFISGGVSGSNYRLTNTITTSDNQTLNRSFIITVKEL